MKTTTRTRPTRMRTGVVAAVAVAIAAAGFGVLAVPAQADIGGVVRGAGHVVSVRGYTLHIMQYVDSQGRDWYCPQPQLPSPTNVTGAMAQASAGYVNAQGQAQSAATMQAVSALLWRYGQTGNNDQAAAVLLAMRSLLNLTATPIEGTAKPVSWALSDPASLGSAIADQLGLRQRVLDMIAWATATANPGWDGSGTLASSAAAGATVPPDTNWTATVTLPGLGAGRAVLFTLTSPDGVTTQQSAQTDAGGTAALTTTIPATPAGTWTVTAKLAEPVPPQWATQQPAPGLQALLLGGGTPLAWAADAPVSVAGGPFVPSVATTPQNATVVVGQPNRDQVSGTCLPGDTVAGTVSLYDGFASSAEALAADVATLTPAGRGTFSLTCPESGRFSAASTPVVATKPGVAFFYEHVEGTDRSVAVDQQASGRATELVSVEGPAVSTQMRTPDGAALGQAAFDDVTITGLDLPEGTRLSASWYAQVGYAPVGADGTCQWAQTTVVAQSTTVVTDTAGVLTGVLPAAMDQPGCVGYAGRLTVTDGEATVATVEHPFGAPGQYVQIAAPAPARTPAPVHTPAPAAAPAPQRATAPVGVSANTGGTVTARGSGAAGAVAALACGTGCLAVRRRMGQQAGRPVTE